MSEQRLVVMGASSGGLESMLALLPLLQPDFEVPIILVLHQKPNRTSGVPAMLASRTHLKVFEPDDKQHIEPGHLYVAPPNYHLLVEKEKVLSLCNDEPVNFCRPAIDVTFESAAYVYGGNLVACVLTGSNRDGAEGAVMVKQRGGRVYVLQTSEPNSMIMPAAVADAVAVDGELSIQEMAAMLNALTHERQAK